MKRLGLIFSVSAILAAACVEVRPDEPVTIGDGTSAAGVGDNHEYYKSLLKREDLLWCLSLRDQEETNKHTHGNKPPASDVVYVSRADASEIRLGAGKESIFQVRRRFRVIRSGRLLATWDFRLNPSWASQRGAIHTHKAWMLGQSGRGDNRRLEIRFDYRRQNLIDVRPYHVGGRIGKFDRLEPIRATTIFPGRMTRYWILVDFDAKTCSKWVADTERGPIMIYDKAPIPLLTSLDWFWIEFNSSQPTLHSPPRSVGWMRNLIMLAGPNIDVNPILVRPTR